MKQKVKTAVIDPFTPSSASGNMAARDANKKAKALLKGIRKPGLKALRNKILRRSIEAFEKEGRWISGNLYFDNGMCAIGAVKRFSREIDREKKKDATQSAVYALVDSIPNKPTPGDYMYGLREAHAVVEFNDEASGAMHRNRVIKAFKKALKAPLRKEPRT